MFNLFKKSKKGQVFQNLGAMAVGIAALAITLTVAFLIVAQGRTQGESMEGLTYSNITQCHQSNVCNATDSLREGMNDIPGWIPLIVIAVIGSVLLGLVALFRRRG